MADKNFNQKIQFYDGGKRSKLFEADKKRSKFLGALRSKDKFYPVSKEKGYYSDIISNEAQLEDVQQGPSQVTQDTLWQTQTERHIPKAEGFQCSKEDHENQMHTQMYDTNTEEHMEKRRMGSNCMSGADFIAASFEPKVQLSIFNHPGERPKNIELERLRRLFTRLDVTTLLKERNVKVDQLMPKIHKNLNVILMMENCDPAPFPPYLPLHIFDNTEFDPRTWQEWLKLGKGVSARYPIPSLCLLPSKDADGDKDPTDPTIEYNWFEAGVLDYDVETGCWLVQKTDENCRVVDASGVTATIKYEKDKKVVSTNQFWIHRWRIMFRAEDPRIFADRIAFATEARRRCEAELRYNLYIDCMPTDGLGDLSKESFASIERRAHSTPGLAKMKSLMEWTEKIKKEISLDYCRVMNKYIFDKAISDDPETFAFVTTPDLNEYPVPAVRGTVDMPPYPYQEQSDSFAYSSIYTMVESIYAMMLVRAECDSLAAMSIFNVKINKLYNVQDFQYLQYTSTNFMTNYIKNNWLENLKKCIRKTFSDVRKGWFNIYEENWAIYQISKLKKFIDTVKFIMQDTLRFLVVDSLTQFTQMIVDCCHSTMNVRPNFKWPKCLISSPFLPRKNPIFKIELLLDDKAHYNADNDVFSDMLLQMFDNGINASWNVSQIEKFVMQDIFWAETPVLEPVSPKETQIRAIQETLKHAIYSSFIPLNAYAKKYEVYLDLVNLDIKEYINETESNKLYACQISKMVEKHLADAKEIADTLPISIHIGPYCVNVDNVRDQLIKKYTDMVKALLDSLARALRKRIDDMNSTYKSMLYKITDVPNCIEDLFALRDWINSVPDKLEEHSGTAQLILNDLEVLSMFNYSLAEDDFIAEIIMISWPLKIEQLCEKKLLELEEDEVLYFRQLDSDTVQLSERLETLQIQIAGMAEYHNLNSAHEYANEMRRMYRSLRDCQTSAQLYNSREKLFKIKQTNYSKIAKILKEFDPFRKLWITTSDWKRWQESWLTDPMNSINADEVERCVNDSFKTMNRSVRYFATIPAVQEVAQHIKSNIENFRPHVPLIQALTNPGLRTRHWEQISEEVGMHLRPGPNFTFTKALEYNLEEYIEKLVVISDVAAKEYAIENALDKMEKDWEPVEFEVQPYKNTGTFMLKSSDETSQQLDDHIVITQSMTFSPYKKQFEQRIANWERTLQLTQDVMEEWLNVQRAWLYLEPIFRSEDIIKQLPTEAKRYNTMERIWRKVMRMAKSTPQVIQICPDEDLLKDLRKCNDLLTHVQKGLSDYLETKRSSFPRFFFLSDDELLEILSQTKDPRAVQPHLRKCFENINKLKFEDDRNKMTRMCSAEGEWVDLSEDLYPIGNVEDWLSELENVMRLTLRHIISLALVNYKEVSRSNFVVDWPGQVVIAVCQTYWSAQVADALAKKSVADYFTLMLSQLDGLRTLVTQDISRTARMTLSALIVIEVHNRDVVDKIVQANIADPNAFEWISQLRYYWLEDENLYQRAVNAQFPYGYEYLGNTPRLVITPLTDRCYLTLTGALHLKFGGAPAGPAGTGKTETTKDLGKAFAIQCVVFNCSDQLDYLAMAKFFKGLASSGAWACFDEFNRIDIEVLSVVAQQVATIRAAQLLKMETFIFEGIELVLKQSCAVFITMNPGYAGRTELPDNLKALFRGVAMMVPDYGLIAEISLFSFGFSGARNLARKIVSTFKLSSEQLSAQDHYDFGMRAVKSVISAAGNLKKNNPTMDEQLICLRAIQDVNVPKFLTDDLKLFNGIVSDLFPNVKEEPIDYGNLNDSLRSCCLKAGLKDVDEFIHKVIQLYETTVVRHGLMLVGPTGTGKTQCYKMLKAAQTELQGELSPSKTLFTPTHTYVLNPKSITMGQLYGEFDPFTHEWTDGILSTLIRIGTTATDEDKRWYLFDGPVDAVWIENMNTVLDDNKKLCLSSGEIIKLTQDMTMMFEVADLAVASPATVSRCGMVYMGVNILGIKPFVECWLLNVPEILAPHKELMEELFDYFLEPAIQFLRSSMTEIVGSVDCGLVFSLLKLFDCFIGIFRLAPMKKMTDVVNEENQERVGELVEPWFFFSLVWSLGATCDGPSRVKFSNWLREKMTKYDCELPFPEKDLVYDYKLDTSAILEQEGDEDEEEDIHDDDDENKPIFWKHWLHGHKAFEVSSEMKFSDIIVPTIDTVRSSYILNLFITNQKQLLAVGPTGTGKTVTIVEKMTRHMAEEFLPEFINFSAKTSANQTQDLIDGKLDKRRKGIFGPPVGKHSVFFIDDLNMPALETYGAQPPIELIRQFSDFRGWYDRKAIGEFKTLVDVNFLCAMGPPGGGRNPVSARLLRHFNYLSFTEMDDPSMYKIFHTLLDSWIVNCPSIQKHCEKLVWTTIAMYNKVQKEMLPTPSKSHYTFNMRDLSKVFQGILMGDHEENKTISDLLRLWYHESCRVFQDRLVNLEDRDQFEGVLRDAMMDDFTVDMDKVVAVRPVLYVDFLQTGTGETNPYLLVSDLPNCQKVIEDFLQDYNHGSTKKMELVLFMDAISHIARITRILRQPLGNALLLGMGGSGRQSLTRLSAYMQEYECYQVELVKNYGVHEWHEDLKKVMMKAGIKDDTVVFLFSDTQIKNESFLEDVNNILNTGDVPNIYSFDETEAIFKEMKPVVMDMGLQPTKTIMFSTYTKRVRSNLHTVITMSPLGEIFRARLRQFPALVNCCTIDWFDLWPTEALQSVGRKFLDSIAELECDSTVMSGLVDMCPIIHESVTVASKRLLNEMGRYNYVTPTSYLELLGIYSNLVKLKRNELTTAASRLRIGLDKILSTTEEVKILQAELEEMTPELDHAVKEATETMERIAVDTKVAEKTKIAVAKEERAALEIAMSTEAIAEDAQRDLDEALPALEAALNSLKSLNKNDITEVRALQRPPPGVKLVIEAFCIMKQVKPKRVPGEKPGTKIDDYWEPGKAQLQDPGKFLDSLFSYDKENIPEDVIKKIKPYIENPNFHPDVIAKVSKACTSVCQWVGAMYKYYFIALAVAPKREKLRVAKKELAETERVLWEAKEKLHIVETGVAELQRTYNAAMTKKQKLEDKCKLCMDRLERADKLINSLADEKDRWAGSIQGYVDQISCIPGDVIVSAGFIAYLGPFTSNYRSDMVKSWTKSLHELKIPSCPTPNLITTMSDPVKIRSWQIMGLPGDSYSVENGVIVNYSRRWPLFIDPQGQANKWIKKMEEKLEIEIIKQSSKDFIRTLETCIRFGKPCLMENMGQEIDPSLEPILLRQVFKQQGNMVIKMGDNIIPYHKDFKFYLTSKLPNPHYTPEVSTKVTIINFTLSPSGLQDQLLGLVVAEERPDLEDSKNQLIVSNANMKQELKDIEDRILYLLSASQGSPVDDVELIDTLDASKTTASEIQKKVKAAEVTEKTIDETRSYYNPVALNAQIMFFCMSDMAKIDPMYQYSLEWFVRIFVASIGKAEKADTLSERVNHINDFFTYTLFVNVCRSLFEKHKLLFGLLMTVRKEMEFKLIDMDEWQWLIAGGGHIKKHFENPSPDWLTQHAWQEIMTLQHLPNFSESCEHVIKHLEEYKEIFESNAPEDMDIPGKWGQNLTAFQKILMLKALRPDKVTNAMQMLVAGKLGQKFIEPMTSDLSVVFKDSSVSHPLVFILSTGTDPAKSLNEFAETMKFSKRLNSISLGQGQGPRAENLMKSSLEKGGWVFFQNCHLSPSWMPTLERLVEQINPDTVHKDFRLWLTSMPSEKFPVYILQNSSKMTVEPPKGIKANLLKSYMGFTDKFFKTCHGKVKIFKHLLLSICFFHAVALERRKYGALGFNIPYEFTDGDLNICIDQLNMFLQEYNEIPYKVLIYTAGEINYGGRVTDDWDRRCLMNILSDFYSKECCSTTHVYSASGIYKQLAPDSDIGVYLDYIRDLPINDTPEIFGMHDNANITFANNQTTFLLGYLMELQPKTATGGGLSREEVLEDVAKDILSTLPKKLNQKEVQEKYPVMYEQSMNTVLLQEVIRFNRLLGIINQSLVDLLKALKGLVVMSQTLENMSNSLFNNTVPAMWASKAYPSLKPLAAWITDLIDRMAFISSWVDEGIPTVFWISGFFFPQAFLTGTMQNFARREQVSIDTVSFDFMVIRDEDIEEEPEKGCYIDGMFLEGASWNEEDWILADPKNKQLFSRMPAIHLIPVIGRLPPSAKTYFCPLYKTLTRAGTLSTTGHSTNFVFTVELPTQQPQKYWIKQGAALMCALNF